MNYKKYPLEFWPQIEKTIFNLQQTNQKLIAAFDADGTLWDTDLGENFFQYQIEYKQIPLPPEPYEYYLNKKEILSLIHI